MNEKKLTIEQVNEILPQTQCELCTYKGCQPYAEAIVNQGERIDRCLPGGERVLRQLADLTSQDAAPYLPEMRKKQKPPMVAAVREDECIGCTKCIQACPVDAILGATKQMHTVIESECTGCELCIDPCPVDCIDLIKLGSYEDIDPKQAQHNARYYRQRYEFRQQRLAREKEQARKKHQRAKQLNQTDKQNSREEKQRLIQEAVARAKKKSK